MTAINKEVSPRMVICIIIFSFLLVSNHLFAQAGNISLQGDNYINIHNAAFPAKINWDQLTNESGIAGEYPVETYWYVRPADAHIVVHLAASGGSIFIELSRKKTVYHFPADYSIEPGGYNDFEMYINDNSGTTRELSPGKNAQLTVNVEELDQVNLKLNIAGTVSVSKPGTTAAIDGKIVLKKSNYRLARLPDTYPDCDNTIYNNMSPHYDLGQWRTATACEESFYRNAFSVINTAMAPVYASLKARKWILSVPDYKPLKYINLARDLNNDYFLVPGGDYRATGNADPMKGEFHDYTMRILNFTQSAAMSLSDTSKMKELERLSKQGEGRFEVAITLLLNKKVDAGSLDFSRALIKKINDQVYIVSGIKGDYHRGAGTYIFIGSWGAPQWEGGYFTLEPQFPVSGKKLSVQAFYVYLGCNDELAAELLKYADLNKLTQLLSTTP